MSDLFGRTENNDLYLIDDDGEVEVSLPDRMDAVYLTEMDLRVMLRKVERVKDNPSGRQA